MKEHQDLKRGKRAAEAPSSCSSQHFLVLEKALGLIPNLPFQSPFFSSRVLRRFLVRDVDRKRTGSISRSFLNYEPLIVPASQEVYYQYTLCLSHSALKTGQASHSEVTNNYRRIGGLRRFLKAL